MLTSNGLPLTSIRGIVRTWIEGHAAKLGNNVLEVGSRMHSKKAWWICNRDLAKGNWIGMDMQTGPNVDVVANLYDMPEYWTGRFTGALCCEVLEHVARPWDVLTQLNRILVPGGVLIVTAPWCLPKHEFPDDFFRYSPNGLRSLLELAKFTDVETKASVPMIHFDLNDHGGKEDNYVGDEPTHSYAVAYKAL